MMSGRQLSLALFIGVAVFGTWLAGMRQYGVIYVDVGDGRGPAAVRRAYDVSDLQGLALSKKIHEQVIGGASVLKRQDAIGLELGQFVTEGPDHRKAVACAVYDHVQLVFIADGEASSSQAPEMLVEGDCRTASDRVLTMRPIWIPVEKILASPTSTKVWTFYDAEPVSLSFSFLSEQWPRRWVLDSLRLYDSKRSAREVIVTRPEIREVAPDSIILDW